MMNLKRVVILICGVLALTAALVAFLIRLDSPFPAPVQVSVTRSNAPLRVFPGVTGVFLVLPDGSLWNWGQLTGGQGPRPRMPQRVDEATDWVQAFAANNHRVALKSNGTLWEWGWRGGRPTTTPEQVNAGTNWIGIAAGDVHSVALRRDGTLWAWGDNSNSQLGRPGPNQTDVVQVEDENDWMAVTCGFGSMTYALKTNGTLWAWGSDFTTTLSQPTRVDAETNWVGFERGPSPLVRNRAGELWQPLVIRRSSPLPASKLGLLISTNAMSGHFALAYCGRPMCYELRPDGTLWQASFTYQSSAGTGQVQLLKGAWQRVGTRSDWIGLWGNGTAIGLTADGTVWAWGVDLGLEPRMDFASRCRWLEQRVLALVGLAPAGLSTVSVPQFRTSPARVMVIHSTPSR